MSCLGKAAASLCPWPSVDASPVPQTQDTPSHQVLASSGRPAVGARAVSIRGRGVGEIKTVSERLRVRLDWKREGTGRGPLARSRSRLGEVALLGRD